MLDIISMFDITFLFFIFIGATVTTTFANDTTADALEVNQNFEDITLDTCYDDGTSITVDGSAVTLNGSHASNITLDINQTATAATGTVVDINNDSTGKGLLLTQDGVLANTNNTLKVDSTVAQTNTSAHLVNIVQDHSGSTQIAFRVQNDGTGTAAYIYQEGVLASSQYGLFVQTPTAQTASHLVYFLQDHTDSDQHTLQVDNDGSGHHIDTDAGSGTPAYLNNDGTWTNASSCHVDKVDVKPDTTKDYLTKLKKLKLFDYQKKRQVYGGRITDPETGERKFPKKKRFPNAPRYKGYILDDASTPEELIERNVNGEMGGVSPEKMANFLLGATKELLARLEVLESA